MLFAQINTKEMLMFENYFDPDDDYDDDGYDEDNGFGDDGDDDEDDYDDYGDAGDGGGNGGGKSDKGADNDESGYGDDTGDGFGEETKEKTTEEQIADKMNEQESEFRKEKDSERWDGDTNSSGDTFEKARKQREEDFKAAGKVEGGKTKGKAAEEKLAKKNATRWSSLLGIPVGIRAVGTCPGCGKKTIYQSMTAIDLIIFKAILSLTKSPLNVYFCMNSGKNCRLSFEKGMCWMCAGKFEPTTMPVPYPLKLFRFNK